MKNGIQPTTARSWLSILILFTLSASPPALGEAAPTAQVAAPTALAPLWAQAIGGSNREWLLGFAVAPEGGLYLTGHFQGGTELAPGVALRSAGASDLYVARLADDGELVWAWQLGGHGPEEGRGVAVDAAGNLFLCGFFSGEATFSFHAPGTAASPPSPTVLTSAGSSDAFVAKFSPAGELLWSRSVGGKAGDVAYHLAVDGEGGVYLTGYFQDLADFAPPDGGKRFLLRGRGSSDAFVARFDATGNLLWARQLGGAWAEQGRAIAVDREGRVTVLGHFEKTLPIIGRGGEAMDLQSAGGNDLLLWRLDAAGTTGWVKRFGGPGPESGEDLAVAADGGLVIVGSFSGRSDFAGTELVSAGSADAFITHLSVEGEVVWSTRFGGAGSDLGFGVEVGADQNVYAVGFTQLASTEAKASGEAHGFVLKLDAAGRSIAETELIGDQAVQALRVGRDRQGRLFIGGLFKGRADLDPRHPGRVLLESHGKFDAFVAELAAP